MITLTTFNKISIDCNATKIHIDLTGGWKSALLLYLCAKDINDNQTDKTSIVPCVVNRTNRYNVEHMNRPMAIDIVKNQLLWIKEVFPSVQFDALLSIDADFWWMPPVVARMVSVDISEKVLLRHVYETCTNDKLFKIPNLIENSPIIKSFNAYCKDHDLVYDDEKNQYVNERIYEHGVVINSESGKAISLCDGNVIALQPFANTTKTNLIAIAKDLNILEDLDRISYTCEQSTKELVEPCGVCFNCKQMKRAIENNDQSA